MQYCPEQTCHSCSGSFWQRLLGWAWSQWNSSNKDFWKSCHVTLKVFHYNLMTLSQLYKVMNKHSQSTKRNPSTMAQPLPATGALTHNANAKILVYQYFSFAVITSEWGGLSAEWTQKKSSWRNFSVSYWPAWYRCSFLNHPQGISALPPAPEKLGFWSHTWLPVPPWDRFGKASH